FAALHAAKDACRPDVRVGLEFVLMRDNTRELPALLRRAVSLGASFALVTHVLPYTESGVPMIAFDANMDGAIELFAEWKDKARREGLDIGEYFKVLWKYMRTPTERELALFIAEMASDTGGTDQVCEIIGSSLPSKQITIKSFEDTRGQLYQLFGNDEGWREALEHIHDALADPGLQGAAGIDRAEALVRSWTMLTIAGEAVLTDYLALVWKYSRTPREQRLYDMVEEMKAEARARDISLHLKNLMERDEEWAVELERIFAEARSLAEQTGLDLTLPGTSPSSNRRCDFIESGSAFISWSGTVHPCYFLWHQYGCHLFGRKKFVNPKVFGSVTERGILDIWNDPAFRSFRDDVLLYDFPYCSNCNVVPCQFLMAEEFEQDCYANTVPCGDCFWCMGMFNCLL
nr:SPASM domain-containing protein [Geobacteraceae bacterium]